jgi:tagaturonate reductase
MEKIPDTPDARQEIDMAVSRRPAETADAVNRKLERLMPVLTPLGIVCGFLLPGVFIRLRPFVTLLFSVITVSGALKLRAGEFGRTLRSPLPILLSFVSLHALMPVIALASSSLFFRGDTDTVAGFVLLYSGPTAVSGFMWVTIFGGDPALCLTLILIDSLLTPLVTPWTMRILMGTGVTIPMTGIAVSLFLMVVLPTIAGVAVNEISRGKIPSLVCPYLNPLSKILLTGIIAANTSPVAPLIRFEEPKVWGVAALCVVLTVLGYIVSKLTGSVGTVNPEKKITLFFTGGLRNISAVTTIAVQFFPGATVLPALLGIVFQQSIAAVMGRILLENRERSGL